MLDFRMDTFLTVCETMNFTRAAEMLRITQPAVSQHIRYIEQYYGVKLFCVEGKKIVITKEGKLLRNTILTMKHDVIFLQKKLHELPARRSLYFGVTLTVGEYVIPEAVQRYLHNHPDTAIRMIVENTQNLLKKLNSGEIDFALVEGYFAKNEYDHLIYSTEPYIAVAGKEYPFKKKPHILEDLLFERLLIREKGSGTRTILEKHLEERNLQLSDFQSVVEIGNISAIKQLAQENCGITFLYEAAVKKEIDAGTLAPVFLDNFKVEHDFTFIWRRNSVFVEDYKELYEELKAENP